MARNEFGEVELVLGTKQLIGVFLIVVMLLGVFASMGYLVGRSSSAPATEAAKNVTSQKPIEVAKPTDQEATPAPASDENKEEPASNESKPAPSPAAAAPATTPLPAPAAAEQKPKPSPVEKPVEKAVAAPKPTPKPAEKPSEAPRIAISEPASGQYWQVMAAERPDAELIAEELSKKGLKALLAPAPKGGYYRVLVGPFDNPARMAEIRTDLEKAGFKNPIVRKY